MARTWEVDSLRIHTEAATEYYFRDRLLGKVTDRQIQECSRAGAVEDLLLPIMEQAKALHDMMALSK
jgi:hypothetical protein